MKNTFLKIAFMVLATAGIISCDETHKEDNSSYLSDRTPVTYFAEQGYTLLVRENETSTVEVNVGSSDTSNSDREYFVTVDPASDAVEGVDYTASFSNLTIPAGQNFGSITITAGDFSNASIDGKSLILNLESVEGSDIMYNLTTTVNIIKFCPIDAPFTGDYLIEELTPFVDGPTLQDGDVVTVYNIEGSETQRGFMTANYVDYCATPNEFIFDLICGNVLIPNNPSNCSCSGNLFFTNATVPSTFDPMDDSVFEITFTNDEFEDCSAAAQTTYRFTKQ